MTRSTFFRAAAAALALAAATGPGAFAQDKVAVVREGQKITAIVTKIDLIEHLARQ